MKHLLHLDSSPLSTSVSRELAREYASAWKRRHPAGHVTYRDLSAQPPAPIGMPWIYATHTPAEQRTAEQEDALAESDLLIGELLSADELVVGVAMHNFSIPSVLKLWIDQVVRVGRTFSYDASGPKGLVTGKKLTILTATGGHYEPGSPASPMNFAEPYLRAMLGFIGLVDVTSITAGGTIQIMTGQVDRAAFLAPTLEQVRSAAG